MAGTVIPILQVKSCGLERISHSPNDISLERDGAGPADSQVLLSPDTLLAESPATVVSTKSTDDP